MLVVQFSSLAQSCLPLATPWTAAHQASLSTTNSQSLLRLMSIKSVMPSNCLILYCRLLLPPSIFSSIRVFSNKSVLPIRWPKYCNFSFIISPSKEYSGLISFRIDWLDRFPCSPRDSQESSPTPQFKSINSLVLSFLYGPTLTSMRDYWKNHRFDFEVSGRGTGWRWSVAGSGQWVQQCVHRTFWRRSPWPSSPPP